MCLKRGAGGGQEEEKVEENDGRRKCLVVPIDLFRTVFDRDESNRIGILAISVNANRSLESDDLRSVCWFVTLERG